MRALWIAFWIGAASPAVGEPIDALAVADCVGETSCRIGGATLTASPEGARFVEAKFREAVGIGVDHQNVGGERDRELQVEESVTIAFDLGRRIDAVTLAHLYNPSEFPGDPVESARIVGVDETGASAIVTVTSLGNEEAQIDGDAVLAGRDVYTGQFFLRSLFATTLGPIKSLTFEAISNPSSPGRDDSDYSIALVLASAAR